MASVWPEALQFAEKLAASYRLQRFDFEDLRQELSLTALKVNRLYRGRPRAHLLNTIKQALRHRAHELARRKKLEARWVLPLADWYDPPKAYSEILEAELRIALNSIQVPAVILKNLMLGLTVGEIVSKTGINYRKVYREIRTIKDYIL